jgi:1-acyl-sn-glycerol-3-phosphate acyltransferase
MVRAKHHFFLAFIFRLVSKFTIHRNFHEIKISDEFKDRDLPLLVIANHFSWWDGILINYLNIKCFKRKFHFMVHESHIGNFWFFKYIGAFSVRKNSISIIDTFSYIRELLQVKSNLVLIFPQGEIRSQHSTELEFEKGIDKIISIVDNEIQIVLVVNLTDYFSSPKPTLYSYLKEFELKVPGMLSIKETYNAFYKECLEKHKKMVDRL